MFWSLAMQNLLFCLFALPTCIKIHFFCLMFICVILLTCVKHFAPVPPHVKNFAIFSKIIWTRPKRTRRNPAAKCENWHTHKMRTGGPIFKFIADNGLLQSELRVCLSNLMVWTTF
jgi:hypothetical protein